MGGQDGAVSGGRELLPDPVEDFRHHFLVGGRRPDRPDLERVRLGVPVLAVQPNQDRSRFIGIDPPVVQGLVAEHQDDIVIPPFSGEIALLEDVEVMLDVAAQGVETGLIKEHHLA